MKKRISIRKTRSSDSRSGSPYWSWISSKQRIGGETEVGEHDLWEPAEANPDQLPETAGLWFESEEQKEQHFNHNLKLKRALGSALSKMTETDREIVTLMSQQFFSIRKIAEKLGVSKGFVQSRLHKIRRMSVQNLK